LTPRRNHYYCASRARICARGASDDVRMLLIRLGRELHSDDLRHVFLASGRTRKLADMLENPAVSLVGKAGAAILAV
jgi:hypothetical protein